MKLSFEFKFIINYQQGKTIPPGFKITRYINVISDQGVHI